MYRKEQIEAYRAISAPEGLRESILSLETAAAPAPRRRATWGSIAAAAACLLLVTATLLYGLGGARPMQFSVDGQVLTAAGVTLPEEFGGVARATTLPGGVTVPLTLDAGAKTTLFVTAGYLEETAADGTVLQSGAALTVAGETALFWHVEMPTADGHASLTAESGRETCTLTLSYDAAAHSWTVSRP